MSGRVVSWQIDKHIDASREQLLRALYLVLEEQTESVVIESNLVILALRLLLD